MAHQGGADEDSQWRRHANVGQRPNSAPDNWRIKGHGKGKKGGKGKQSAMLSTPGWQPGQMLADAPAEARNSAMAAEYNGGSVGSGGFNFNSMSDFDSSEVTQSLQLEQEALQQVLARQVSRMTQQDLELRLLRAQLHAQQTQPVQQQYQQRHLRDGARPMASPERPRPRPPAPCTVPQHLWDKALDEAPRIAGRLRWVLRERSKFGLVHDSRVAQHFSAKFAAAVPGMRCRKAHAGTDGSLEVHWRHGSCLRPHATLGKWWARFDDSDQEEVIDCGFQDVYDTNPLPPVKPGLLEEATTEDGQRVLRCRNPLSGEYYKTPQGTIIEIPAVRELKVTELREAFEEHSGHPNGIRLITPIPNRRVLDPFQDHRKVEDALEATEEQMLSEDNRLVLELFHVKDDGTQTLFWHTGTTAGANPGNADGVLAGDSFHFAPVLPAMEGETRGWVLDSADIDEHDP